MHDIDGGLVLHRYIPRACQTNHQLFASFANMLCLLGLTLCTVFSLVPGADSRRWNDTGVGTIVFEEAWGIPSLLPHFRCIRICDFARF